MLKSVCRGNSFHAQGANRLSTILVVEDETVVLQIVSQVLRMQGHTVVEAADRSVAIAELDQPFDLVILDSGQDTRPTALSVADALRRKQPNARVLRMSGYPREGLIQNGTLKSEDEFLAKPFTPDQLREKVNQLLAQSEEVACVANEPPNEAEHCTGHTDRPTITARTN